MNIEEIKQGESSNVEYKVDIPKNSTKYIKTVIAFANGRGGKVIFGVENSTWDIKGFDESEVFLKADAITNAIYDSCTPKIMPEVYVENVDGKYIIVVEVSSGMQKPYCLSALGPMDGTFIRGSGTTRAAGPASLKQLILDGTNRSFDQIEDNENLLNEKEIEAFCKTLYSKAKDSDLNKNFKQITVSQLLSWKIIYRENEEYHPSNAYYLLKGDEYKFPDAKIQCAVFKGTTRDIFITKKDISGPIYEQIDEAYNFVLQHINIGSRIEGIKRRDFYELPVKTIRELIANAVCHRSYIETGNIQIALYDDRLEITSPGTLDPELTIDDLKSGRSKLRNKAIAHVFRYLDIIETWGSGIPKLYREARSYGLRKPEIIEMGDAFRVNLFRKPFETDEYGVINPEDVGDKLSETENVGENVGDNLPGTENVGDNVGDNLPGTENVGDKLSAKERRIQIVNVMMEDSDVTASQLAEKFFVTNRTIERDIEILKNENKIHREGSDISGKWIVD